MNRKGSAKLNASPVQNDREKPVNSGTIEVLDERKRLEQALRSSEERYRLLFDRSPLPKWVFDLDTLGFLEVNEAAVEHYGYSREEFLQLTIRDIRTPEEFKKMGHCIQEFREQKSRFEGQVQTKHRKKNGEIIDADVHYTEIVYNGRRVALGAVTDITERKRAEEALLKREQEYKTLAENSPEVIARFDRELRHTYINNYGTQVYGLPKDRIIGRTSEELGMPAGKVAFWRQHFEEVFASGVQRTVDFDFESPNLGHQYFSSLFVPEFDTAGSVASILAITRDVTQVKKSEQALKESEEALRTVFNSVYDGIILHLTDGSIVDMNERFLALYGVDREELFKLTIADISSPSSPLQDLPGIWSKVIAGEPQLFEWKALRPRDGSEFDVEVFLRRVHLHGRAEILATVRDITERKQADEELQKLVSDLERSNRELEQFAYVASHDLQEPLRMVASYVQLLERKYRGRLDEAADKYIHFATDGALRMQKLIEGLLAYSRIGRRGSGFRPVNAAAAFDSAVSNLRAAIRESGAVVTRDELPVVEGDKTQLLQLFQNLIANAIKFRQDAPPRIHASAARRQEKNANWIFSVKDNGIGIEPRYFERIFQIFQRLHSRAEYPGTGIGLALTKRIVERHHGRIWVESVPGEGSTFFFTIETGKGYPDRTGR